MTPTERDQELVDFLAAGRARMPAGTDARLQQALAHAGSPAKASRRGLWLGAAAVLAGVAVILGVSLWAGDGDRDDQGVSGARQDPNKPQDPKKDKKQPAPAPAPRPEEPIVEDKELVIYGTAAQLLVSARNLGVFELTPRQDGTFEVKTLRWILAPDGPLDRFILTRDSLADRPGSNVLAFHQRSRVPETGGIWLLDVEGHGSRDGLPLLRPAAPGRLRGIPLHPKAPTTELPTERQRLLGELLRTAHSGGLSVRRVAIAALLEWEGPDSARHPGRDTLWAGIAEAEPGLSSVPMQLLNLSRDSDPSIRARVAEGIPACAGPAGRRTLERLAFDRRAGIRRAALSSLGRYGVDWLHESPGLDSWWTVMTYPSEQATWLHRCREAATEAGLEDPIAIWQRQLQKPRHENHLLGAIGLGTTGLASAVDVLITLENHEDPRVRAAAAGSRIRLGDDRRGWQILENMLADKDPKVGAYVMDVARTFDDRRALAFYDNATDSEHAYVRALAAGALLDVRALAQHLVDTRRGDLRGDDSDMVRAAAKAY